jgi:hypothetical protein
MPAMTRATLIATSVVIITCAGFYSASVPQMLSSRYPIDSKESTKSAITRALSAGPSNVTKGATVADMDSHGTMHLQDQGLRTHVRRR